MAEAATLAELFMSDLLDDSNIGMDTNQVGMEIDEKPTDPHDLQSVVKLRHGTELPELLDKIQAFQDKNQSLYNEQHPGKLKLLQQQLQDEGYQLILQATDMVTQTNEEIKRIVKFVRDIYDKTFSELEELVPNPLDYVKTVKSIGNKLDVTDVMTELTAILPRGVPIMVSIAISTKSNSSTLSEEDLAKVLEGCEEALHIDSARATLLSFVEGRMPSIAPNLAAIVGSGIAAKLLGAAGGLTALAKIPSGNLRMLGLKEHVLAGFSSSATNTHTGYINDCDLVQNAPKHLKKVVRGLVGNKCALAVRADATGDDKSGKVGRAFREKIETRINQLMAPPPPKAIKPIAAPDSKIKKRRGGKKARKRRQETQMTEMRRQANRTPFGLEAENDDSYTGKGYGMLGKDGSGNIRMLTKDNKNLLKKRMRLNESMGVNKRNGRLTVVGSTTGLGSSTPATAPSGTMTSLSFTPAQPLELGVPIPQNTIEYKLQSGEGKYFSNKSTFVNVGQGAKRKRENDTDNGGFKMPQ